MTNVFQSNRQAYENPDVVEKYRTASLQNAEALIFVQYADSILGKRILDLGCGAGRTTFFLSQWTSHYVGVDCSARMIQACRDRFPEKTFHVGDSRDLGQFGDKTFDFVLFSFNGIDYVDHAGRLQALAEIRRVLTDDGLFVFSSHNLECDGLRLAPRMRMCLNLRRLLFNFRTFLRQSRNYRNNHKREVQCPEYSILNDRAQDWALMTYYISVPNQVNQVNRAGFNILGIWDCDGNDLSEAGAASKAVWVYYVAKKCRESAPVGR